MYSQPPPSYPNPVRPQRPHVKRAPAALPIWFLAGVLGVVLIASVVIGVLVFSAVRSAMGGGGRTVDVRSLPPATQTAIALGTDVPPASSWNCQSYTNRVTVLVMGIDQRSGNANDIGPYRTDTMILLSLDPLNKTAVMLSIPRDLWVTIPDYGYGRGNDRINTANVYGDVNDYPGGGPALAMKTVQLNLGIPVDHYVRLNFTFFEQFIDQIGGIDIVVPEDIYDPDYPDMYYGTELFQISAGPHHLDGATALKYARTRHTIGSDFDRAQRQQQVIMAVRDKVTSLDMLPQLIPQLPGMYNEFQDSVQTSLSLNDVVCLTQISQGVERANIRSATLDEDYTTNWTTPDGAQVLIPERDKIADLMVALYTPPATIMPTVTADPLAAVRAEGARVVIENGTLTAGLAGTTADWLRGLGLNVVDARNADRFDYPETLVIDYTGKAATTRYLAELFNVRQGNVLSSPNPDSLQDVKVVLGADAKTP